MTDQKKLSTLLLVTILILSCTVSIFVYALLHEWSHALVSVLFGRRIIEINYLSIAVEMSILSPVSFFCVGLAGAILPLILLIHIPRRVPNMAYFILIPLRFFAIFNVTVGLGIFSLTYPVPKDSDITSIMAHAPDPRILALIFVIALILTAIFAVSLWLEHPLKRIGELT